MKGKSWLIWSVLVFAYAINFFHSLSMGVVKENLMEEFQISEATFISIGNMYANLYLLMQIPAGLLADWLGPRKTAFAGMLLATAGVALFGASPSVLLLYAGRSLVGLGTSVLFVCILKIQANWFSESVFGTMTGWTCFIGTMGGAFAQTPLAMLIGAVGWRASFMGVSAVSFAVTTAIFFIVQDAPRGLETAAAVRTDSLGSRLRGAAAVLKNPRTWPIFFAYASFYGSYVVLMGYYGTSFIMEVYGKDTIAASLFITAGVIGSAAGAAVIGSLSDRLWSRKKPAVWAGIGYLACWVALAALPGRIPAGALMPFLFITGFLSCAYVVSWPAAREVNNPAFMGVAASVTNMGGFMGSILIPVLAGKVFAAGNGGKAVYGNMFWLVALLVAVGVVSSLLMKETGCKSCYREQKTDCKSCCFESDIG